MILHNAAMGISILAYCVQLQETLLHFLFDWVEISEPSVKFIALQSIMGASRCRATDDHQCNGLIPQIFLLDASGGCH